MDFGNLNADLSSLRKSNKTKSLLIGVLTLCLFLALVIILNIVGTQRTIVVPPTLNKSFWVTDSKVSAEYLEQMGSFIAWLILDVSPSSIEWKKDMLLTYVTPDKFGAFKTKQDLESERLKRINASTYFMPQQLVPTEESQSVVVRGRLRTQVNGQDTTTESKAYRVQFQYAGGRVHLETFEEIANDQKAPTQATADNSNRTH